jgi:hypothetical protein
MCTIEKPFVMSLRYLSYVMRKRLLIGFTPSIIFLYLFCIQLMKASLFFPFSLLLFLMDLFSVVYIIELVNHLVQTLHAIFVVKNINKNSISFLHFFGKKINKLLTIIQFEFLFG